MNPFPGLRPFREEEEYLFFGRETQVDAMVNKLAASHFLAVVGTSGSGKSSLVNCGLRPALHRGLMGSAGTVWRMAYLRPGTSPVRALAEALAKPGVLDDGLDTGDFTLAEIIETNLRMSKLGLIDVCQQARLDENTNLLVVVDQFEELFRFRMLGAPSASLDFRAGEEATAFVNLLLEISERARVPIYIVITMRSDFLGECAQFFGLPEAINKGQYLVPRMTRDERRSAIRGPIGVGGAGIDPVLLTRLVNDVGDNPDQLSILQHALNRTWARWQQESGAQESLELRHYEAIGTMAHALNQHAEEAYLSLGDERKRKICERLFKALTDKGTDARGIRRPTRMDALCVLAQTTHPELAEIIDVFREPSRSFLMPPLGEALKPDTVIDISHESLMRVWERLRSWGDEEAQSAQTYRRLAETAELYAAGKSNLLRNPDLQVAIDWYRRSEPNDTWAQRYHPGFSAAVDFMQRSQATFEGERAAEAERVARQARLDAEWRKHKQMRRVTWAAMCAAILLALVFFYLYQKATDAQKKAEESAKVALAAKAVAEYESLRAKHADAAYGRLDDAVKANPALAKSIDATAAAKPLVYLQIPRNQERAAAERLQKQLKENGYVVPGIESVSIGPKGFELRYFRDAEQDDAQMLAGLIRKWNYGDIQVQRIKGYETRSRLKQFEIWFPSIDSDEITRLVAQMNANSADERKRAVALLERNYRASPVAIAQVLDLYQPDRIKTLSSSGTINGLYYLSSTDPQSWNKSLEKSARDAIAKITEKNPGPQTKEAIAKLSQFLDGLPK